MRLGKLLSAGEVTEAAEMAGAAKVTGAAGQEPIAEAAQEPASDPVPPAPRPESAGAHMPDGRPAVPAAARSGR